ncbi:hypothetical protein ABE501_16460, partial [Comamonas testosteroni]
MNKAFAPSSMTAAGTSTLTITLANTATSAATSAAVTDTLPSGLTVASPSNVATTCGGTVTATPGNNSVSLTGGTIPANGVTCTVTVSVTTSVTGNYTNTIPVGGLTTSQGNNGAAASATLAVITQQPITASWALTNTNGGAGYLKGNGPAYKYTVTLNNPNTMALTNAATTFTLPAQIAFASPNNLATTCGGTLTSTASSGTLAAGTIPANGSCSISFDVIAATPNNIFWGSANLNIAANNITTAQGITNAVAFAAGVGVGTGANVVKSISPNPILSGGTSTLTLTFAYLNVGSTLPLDLTDTFPAGMTVAAVPNISNTCGGLVTAVPGGGSVQLAGGSLPGVAITAGTYNSCTVKVDVTGINNGASCTSPNVVLTNTIPAGNFSGLTYPASSAALTVTPARPLCGSSKAISNYFYAGNAIDVAGSVQTVTITLRNPLSVPDIVTSLTDNLTNGMTVAASPAPSTTCVGGVITAISGASSFSMVGGTIPASNGTTSGSCTVNVSVNVPLSASNTTISNTIPIGGITTVNGSNITAIGSGGVFVYSPLRIAKGLNPSQGAPGTVSQLTITLGNGNGFTIGPALFPLSNITGSDTLPANMVVATPSALATSCTGGTVTAPAGGSTVSFSGINLALNANCTITLNVQVSPTATVGTITNTIASNTVTTNEGPTNTTIPVGQGSFSNGAASAGFGVVNPNVTNVTVNKTFSPANVVLGTPSTVNIQFINTNASNITLTGAALTDALPAGMTVASPASASFTGAGCGGAFTLTATPGASTASLSGAQINAGATCSLKFNVVTNAAGNVINTLPAGALTSAQGISNLQPTVATLAVNGTADLSISKTDNQTTMSTGTSSTYQIVVRNLGPNNVAGALVSDTPPAGMTFTNWTCVATAGAACGAASGSEAISDTININVGSTVTYTVTAQIPINFSGTSITNTATVDQPGSVADANQANNTASDTDTVISGVVLSLTKAKSPNPTTYTPGANATYTITVQNTGPANAGQVNLSDTLPAGVTLTGTPTCTATGTATCGTVAGSSGQTQFTASGATLPSASSGTLTFNVPVMFASNMTAPNIVNTVTAIDVPSQATGTASTPNTLILPSADISIAKSGPSAVVPGAPIQYTLLVGNAGPTDANGTSFSDTVPSTITGVAATCGNPTGGAVCPASVTVTGNAISGTVPTLPANSSVTITVTGTTSSSNTAPITNTAMVTSPANMADPNAGNNTSTATTVAAPVISISKVADVSTLIPGGTVHYTVTVRSLGPAAASNVLVSDPIPAGITAQSWSCAAAGGATCTASGTGAVSDTIAAFPAGASATYTITATVSNAPPATVTNTASSTPGANGVCAPGNTAAPCTAAVTLGSAPIIEVSKTANTNALVPGGTVTYTVTVSNTGASAADDVLVTDPVAGGITSQSWSCAASGGAACPQASGAGGINQTVVLMPTGSSVVYTITATISNTPPTNVSNTAAAMPSESGTVCGPTNTAGPCSATASVPPLPQVSVTKSANVTTVVAGGTIVYTITVSNSGVMPADNTAVSDPIPAGIASQSWTCTASGGASCSASGTGAISDTIATFPAGSYATYTVTAQVSANPPATIGNTVVVTPAAGTLCTPGNTTSPCSASAAVSPDPQISVAKSVDAPTITPGGVVHYTVSVTNNGSVAADGTTVSDPIPAGITAQSWTCAAQAGATCTTSGTGAIT